jgi:probable F420-dependent oxidoreductase
VDFILSLPQRRIDRQEDFGSGEGLARIAQAAERLGFYAMTITDHPLLPLAWEAVGGHHDVDPFTTLAYLAAKTEKLRLMTNIIVLPYRSPIITAKMLATVDLLSGGRVIAGVAAGYLEGEFEALGVPFAERNEMTDEAIRVMQVLWTSEEASFEGRYTRFAGVRQLPHPVQKPHPPIWVGGNSKRAVRRAVELADGWAPFTNPASMSGPLHTAALTTPDDLAGRLAYAREVAERVGRTRPLTLIAPGMRVNRGGSAGTADRLGGAAATGKDELIEHVGRMRELGATACGANFAGKTVEEFLDQMAWFGEEVIPAT